MKTSAYSSVVISEGDKKYCTELILEFLNIVYAAERFQILSLESSVISNEIKKFFV